MRKSRRDTQMDWIRVKDWDEWQSYRTDRPPPPWVKVHRRVFNSHKWASLSDAQKGQLVSLWVLAADNNGWVPNDAKMLQKLTNCDDFDYNALCELGFLDVKMTSKRPRIVVNRAPERRQLDAPEAEAKAEAKAKAKAEAEADKKEDIPPAPQAARGPTTCKDDWLPNEQTIGSLLSEGYTKRQIWDALVEMRDWSQSGGKRKQDWNATLRNWVRRNVKAERPRGQSNGAEKRQAIAEVIAEYGQADSGPLRGDGRGAISPPTERRPRDNEDDGSLLGGDIPHEAAGRS